MNQFDFFNTVTQHAFTIYNIKSFHYYSPLFNWIAKTVRHMKKVSSRFNHIDNSLEIWSFKETSLSVVSIYIQYSPVSQADPCAMHVKSWKRTFSKWLLDAEFGKQCWHSLFLRFLSENDDVRLGSSLYGLVYAYCIRTIICEVFNVHWVFNNKIQRETIQINKYINNFCISFILWLPISAVFFWIFSYFV